MIELALQSPQLQQIRDSVFRDGVEGCAVLFTRAIVRDGVVRRLLAADLVVPGSESYQKRSRIEAELAPEFVAGVTKRARNERLGLVFVHSHPGESAPEFSPTDDSGERHLRDLLDRRAPNATHLALVVSEGGAVCRVLGTNDPVRVFSIGSTRVVVADAGRTDSSGLSEEYDRQVRALGAEGHERLEQLTVAIVGLGGTGSIVAQQLAHLGVRNFLLVDPDTLDRSNLNRVANALPRDVGRFKTELASDYILAVNPQAQVRILNGDVIRAQVAKQLAEFDFLFCCTDSHGSRAVIQQVAYQYLVPCIDMGTTIVALDGVLTHVHGRVQMLAPGLPCLTCSEFLDASEVRRDMMSAFERKADPYIVGERVPAPAVMSLNGTVSSLSVTMLLSAVAGLRSNSRHLLYNAIAPSLRNIAPRARPDCFICSSAGALARGDDAPLMARLD